MYTSIVATLCGPHEDGEISFRRIDVAIETAIQLGLPLVIAGDGNHGRDLVEFETRARARGVVEVIGAFSPEASTPSDVNVIAVQLGVYPAFADVQTIHFVTDYWHMPRASLMLLLTLIRRMLGRNFIITCINVQTPVPHDDVLSGETQGIIDFVAGEYGTNGHAVQYGKPSHPDNVSFVYNFDPDTAYPQPRA